MDPTESASFMVRLRELVELFLRLGILGFGGPQAHIALQNDEAVTQRKWMTQEQFTEGLAVCEMLPGPASTQMGIYIGYLRAGQWGALVAGVCFILPAYLIVVALSWAYFRWQGVPQIAGVFFGVSPVVMAIILGFCWNLGRKVLKDWTRALIALASFGLVLGLGANVLLVFAGAGCLGLWLYGPRQPRLPGMVALLPGAFEGSQILAQTPPEVLSVSSLWGAERIVTWGWPLLLYFLKVGTAIFGGGLVIIPFLSTEVVDQMGWLTRQEFLDGVAIGQLTPGPVVLTAAFIGYKVAGLLGSLVATVGIFAPSFAFIMLAAPLLLRIRQNRWVKGFLQGISPATLGTIAAAAVPLAQNALLQASPWRSGLALTLLVLALVAVLRHKVPAWQLVPAGGLVGLVAGLVP